MKQNKSKRHRIYLLDLDLGEKHFIYEIKESNGFSFICYFDSVRCGELTIKHFLTCICPYKLHVYIANSFLNAIY